MPLCIYIYIYIYRDIFSLVQVVYSVVKTVQLFTVLQLSLRKVYLRTEAVWLGLGCLVPLTFGDS